MELHLFLTIFLLGIAAFYLSTRQNEKDLSNAFQMQMVFLSFITWAAMAFNSFNIQIYSTDSTLSMKSFVDYTFIGLSLAFFILSLLNLIIMGFYGSYTALFNRRSGQ